MDDLNEHWDALNGGYRQRYDPRNAFKAIEANDEAESAWAELWEELLH
ncbi:hypothetical protein [Caulobacter sp. DWR1-3-2b1]